MQGGARQPCQQTSKLRVGAGMQQNAVALHGAPASAALAAITVRKLCPQRIFLMAGRAAYRCAQAAVRPVCYKGSSARSPWEAAHNQAVNASTFHTAAVQLQLESPGPELP